MLVRVCRFSIIQTLIKMNKSELYILIAVFGLLTISLVWFGVKFLLDIRKRKNSQKQHRQPKHFDA
ncbi:hypothetical protein HMPREF0645_0673 [Hallella bergensis DSM 17361]|uniref:Uncharacterized protein n=1 Tax=Hallella bergensis DSM 17361 TaxID=585502 RepID=D1PUN8_9BACT|nr:hypothetical protein HMPREF0645_0673 [Hallella bergensis DSM 17361]